MINNRQRRAGAQTPAATTSVTLGEHTMVLHVVGEVDVLTVPDIDLQVYHVCRSAPAKLVLDLTGVTFLGAAGLTLLLDTDRRTHLTGTDLHLVAPPRTVRLLSITELTDVFRVHNALPLALAAVDDGQPGRAPTNEGLRDQEVLTDR